MTEAAPVARSSEIENFLDTLYEGQEGYVYVPTKAADSAYWQPYFFQWPKQRTAVITHLINQSKDRDTYVAPSVFKAPSDKKAAWKGSNYVWIEFDGNAPDNLPDGIPAPSIRIQSSTKRHEHWYWRLIEFETDYRVVEGLAKQLTYTLDADKSGWDCSQVLRAPGTLHQDSRKRVKLLAQTNRAFGLGDFKNLVAPPESAVLDKFDDVPSVDEVVANYKWDKEAFDLFKKATQPVGSRSSAMTRLAFHCVEMGMSDAECYSVLYNADERWGKYKSRPAKDRAKRLIGIISHCRGKKELDAELRLSTRESFTTLGDFRKTDIKVKWLYQDFLTEQGLGVISASPGVGKTTLSIRLGISVVTRSRFLKWDCKITEQKRVGFLSLEMAGVECRKFIDDMWPSLAQDDQDLVDDNFFILPLGYSMMLSAKENQQLILDEIDKHNIDFLIIDSLKASTGLDEKRMDQFFDWINKHVRNERKCTVWIVHHNRKPPNEGPRKPRGLEDLYGDTFITAHPTAVISIWRRSKGLLEVIPLKVRLAEETDPFVIKRSDNLSFEVTETLDRHEEEESADEDGSSSKFV